MEAHREGARSDPPSFPVSEMSSQEQAALLGDIAATSPDGVLATDPDGRILWTNHMTGRLFGLDADELPGRPITDLVPEQARAGLLDLHGHVVAGEHTDSLLTSGLRRDGSVFDLWAVLGVRRDTHGQPLGISMVLRDVTEQVRLRRELAAAVARSQARFDRSAHPQALLDSEGRIVEVNDAAAELLGWTPAELVGRHSAELVHSAEPTEVLRRLDDLRGGALRSASYEAAGVCKDGTKIPLLIDVTPVRDDEGNAYEFAAFVEDLREIRAAERRLSSQEAFFRGLHREASDVTLVADVTGSLRYITPSVTQVLGYGPEQIRDIPATSLVHPDDMSGQEERRRHVLQVPGARARDTIRFRDVEGRWRWFDTTATNCVDDPDIAGIVISLREVTPEIEAQKALRDSEARYRAIAETAQEGILAVSPEGDTLFANERLAEILGLSMEQVYALGGSGIFPSADVGQAARRVGARRPQTTPERSDVPYHHPDGTDRVLLVSASPLTGADGTVLGSLAMVSDVTEQRAAEETLRRQALHDPLTGLPNRLLFVDRLTLAAARQQRTEHGAIAVLFLDLDHFKGVNDTHGHQIGDRVLVEVAGRLEQAVRATDTVARLGGDEFAVICEGADAATAALVSSRIQQAFKAPLALDGVGLEVSMSIGVALSPPHQAEDLLRLADMAMYQAKATARGRVVTYAEGLPDGKTRRLGVVRAVREALDDHAVPLRYEPVVDLRSGGLTGMRARLHWEHPILGLLRGAEVSTAAESAGLALDLLEAMLSTALRDLGDLSAGGTVSPGTFVAVSISPIASERRTALCVERALSASDAPPHRLLVEVDESEVGQARDLARGLRDLGVGFLVSGVSGGAVRATGVRAGLREQLADLPVSCLELDRSVVERLTDDVDGVALARSFTELAAAVEASSSAEGVATEQQAALLRGVGCARARGPLWGPAVPTNRIAEGRPPTTADGTGGIVGEADERRIGESDG